MAVTIYRVTTEHRGKLVMEHLLCGTGLGSPIRFLAGSVAGAVANHFAEEEAIVIDRKQFQDWRRRQDAQAVVRDVWLSAHPEQREEGRTVVDAVWAVRGGLLGHIALTPGLLSLSHTLHGSPRRALGLPEGVGTAYPHLD